MSKKYEEQCRLSREILLFPELDSANEIEKLKKLSTSDNPSLSAIFLEANNLSLPAKTALTEYAKETCFAKSVVETVVRHKIINTDTASWNSYRNQLLRFSFAISKYLELSHVGEFSPDHWDMVREALVDEKSVWRLDSAHAIRNSARTFIKAVNVSQLGFSVQLKAFSASSSGKRTPAQTQLEYLASKSNNFQKWKLLFEEWSKNQKLKNSKHLSASLAIFLCFLQENNMDVPPSQFLMMTNKPDFWKYIRGRNKDVRANTMRSHALRMYEFTEWIIKDRLSDVEDGEPLTLATSLLPLDVYHHVSGFTVQNSRGKADNIKAILPIKYLSLIRQILTDNDHEWPRSLDWTFGRLKNQDTGEFEEVWCPHLTYLFLFMLEIPVRKIQVLCLDSGEGDEGEWAGDRWVANSSMHAGYWAKNYRDTVGRGVIRRVYEEGEESTALYINTNKTQDIEKSFSASSGYTINWHNESLLKIICSLREWQRRYNPVQGPIKYKDLPRNTFSDSPTEAVLKLIPDRYYLFRYPLNSSTNRNYFAAPPADYITFKFWHALMAELERRLNDMGEDVVITTGWTSGQPSKSVFTPHSLRGSGLTALAEAGVPIEVLSKVIAGHASILMTLGYIKYNNAYISEILDKARLKIEQSEQENYTQYLKNSTWDDAYKYAALNEGFDENEWATAQASGLFENRQIGICPNSGTRCSEGGEKLRKNGAGKSALYSAVPGGSGNCVRCRFLLTGQPFLIPLWLKANKDLADAQEIAVEVDSISKELERLRNERFDIVKTQGAPYIPASLKAEIKQVEARMDMKSEKLNEMLANAHATYNLVEKVKALGLENGKAFPVAITDDLNSDTSPEFLDVSLFRQRDFLVQASRLYPHIRDDKREMERNHFIDQVMFNLGGTPITLSPLTKEEKEAACDAAAEYLNARLSDHEMKLLESGSLGVHEIGITQDDIQELKLEVDGGARASMIALTEVS